MSFSGHSRLSDGLPTFDFRSIWPWLLALVLLAAAVYANTFGNGWTYDDFPVIVENPDVRSLTQFFQDSYPGRPLRELTYLLDYQLFGYQPAGWHIQQIFWHALNGCLVFWLALRLRLHVWVAFLAAALFLVHPIQVEVVANLSHRKDSLALAFELLTILAWWSFLAQGRWRWCWTAVVSLALACLAKQTAATLPLILFLGEWFGLFGPRRILARWPLLSLALAAGAGGLGLVWLFGSDLWTTLVGEMRATLAFKANYFGAFSVPTYFLTVLKSWSFMGLKLFWPSGLAVEYTFPVPSGWFDPWVLACLVVLAGTTVWVVYVWRRSPRAVWLFLSGLILFLPTSNLVPLSYLAADRYFYAPLAFWGLLTMLVLSPLFRRAWARGAGVAVCLALALLSVKQNRVWQSPEMLWQNAWQVSPRSAFALNNLGNIALLGGRTNEAENWYKKSVEVNRLNPTAHYNLGMLAEQRGDLSAALRHYRDFARLDVSPFRGALEQLRQRLWLQYRVRL